MEAVSTGHDFPPAEMALSPITYCEEMSAIIGPLELSCPACYCCDSKVSQLSRIIDYFSSLTDCIAPAGKIQLNSSESCTQSVWYLQQQETIFNFQRETMGNSNTLYCSQRLLVSPNQSLEKRFLMLST